MKKSLLMVGLVLLLTLATVEALRTRNYYAPRQTTVVPDESALLLQGRRAVELRDDCLKIVSEEQASCEASCEKTYGFERSIRRSAQHKECLNKCRNDANLDKGSCSQLRNKVGEKNSKLASRQPSFEGLPSRIRPRKNYERLLVGNR